VLKKAKSGENRSKLEHKTLSVREIVNNNITKKGFFIQKAEIEIISGTIQEKFIAAIKYNLPGVYLISLRIRTGIEIARIYISNDTILANDRINRRLYYGKPAYLGIKYGIPFSAFPAIFGDYVGDEKDSLKIFKCKDGKAVIENLIKGMKLVQSVDCRLAKISGTNWEGSFKTLNNDMIYEKFINSGNIVIPTVITMDNLKEKGSIKISIRKVESPWDGIIEFIPGNRYELIELR
jgi:hypothetical protein